MNSDISISVICFTFNQGKYLRQSLDSLIDQKCSVQYEIIIHDDASTDDSQKIIKEYTEKHPNLIIPILQTKNQVSQGIDLSESVYHKCKGKYIAICEGDDYWNDPYKIQKQYDAMEKHPECCFSSNLVSCCKEDGSKDDLVFPSPSMGIKSTGKINESKMASLLWENNGYPFHTCSYFFTRNCFETSIKLFRELPGITGDQLYMRSILLCGPIWYINEPLSVRRLFPIGGWSMRQTAGGRDKDFDLALKMHAADIRLNELTEHRYQRFILSHIYDNMMGFAPFYPAEVKQFLRDNNLSYTKCINIYPLRKQLSIIFKSILLSACPSLLRYIYRKRK